MKFLEELEKKKAELQRQIKKAEEDFKPGLVERALGYLQQFSGVEPVGEVKSLNTRARIYRLNPARESAPDNWFILQLEGAELLAGRAYLPAYCGLNSGIAFIGDNGIVKKLSYDPKGPSCNGDGFTYVNLKNNYRPSVSINFKEIEIPNELFSWTKKLGFTRKIIDSEWGEDTIIDTLNGKNKGYLCGLDVGYDEVKKLTDWIGALKK